MNKLIKTLFITLAFISSASASTTCHIIERYVAHDSFEEISKWNYKPYTDYMTISNSGGLSGSTGSGYCTLKPTGESGLTSMCVSGSDVFALAYIEKPLNKTYNAVLTVSGELSSIYTMNCRDYK